MNNDYAGFWVRFLANFIDVFISIAIQLIVCAIGFLLFFTFEKIGIKKDNVIFIIVSIIWFISLQISVLAYTALSESSEKQGTIGKRALGLIVTDVNGNRISVGRATGRCFAKFLSVLPLGIGFLMAGFTEKKQGLHDIVAKTLVLKK